MPLPEISVIALIGLIAGMLGGLAGVGGSVFILPALHIAFSPALLGEPHDRPEIHHTYMAAAMAVNFAVSLPAAIQHHRVGAVRTRLLPILAPATLAAVFVGVSISNLLPGHILAFILGVFLILYCAWNLRMIARPRRRKFSGEGRIENATRPRLIFCGAATGLLGGTLGLGGGFLMVPLLQLVCNLRLKNAIATTSAVLFLTAAFSSTLKLITLPQHHESIRSALTLAGIMAPMGVLGALFGATWLHHLPVTAVRTIMLVLILLAATRLL